MVAYDVWVDFIQLMIPVLKSLSTQLPIYTLTVFVLKFVPRGRNVFPFARLNVTSAIYPLFETL